MNKTEKTENSTNKYQGGKIYKIVDNTTNKIYIGSTTEKYLSNRLNGHRNQYKLYLNNKNKYMSSFEILKNNDYQIILLQEYPCETKDQLRAKEREYFDRLECVNKNKPISTFKEWIDDNKEKMKDYKEKWREDNKDKIKEQSKTYRLKNLEEIKQKKKICVLCEKCNCMVNKDKISRHNKTKKHLKHT